MTNVEIEDVLSSIRRLVTAENQNGKEPSDRPSDSQPAKGLDMFIRSKGSELRRSEEKASEAKPAEPTVPEPKLVLTPSQRVDDAFLSLDEDDDASGPYFDVAFAFNDFSDEPDLAEAKKDVQDALENDIPELSARGGSDEIDDHAAHDRNDDSAYDTGEDGSDEIASDISDEIVDQIAGSLAEKIAGDIAEKIASETATVTETNTQTDTETDTEADTETDAEKMCADTVTEPETAGQDARDISEHHEETADLEHSEDAELFEAVEVSVEAEVREAALLLGEPVQSKDAGLGEDLEAAEDLDGADDIVQLEDAGPVEDAVSFEDAGFAEDALFAEGLEPAEEAQLTEEPEQSNTSEIAQDHVLSEDPELSEPDYSINADADAAAPVALAGDVAPETDTITGEMTTDEVQALEDIYGLDMPEFLRRADTEVDPSEDHKEDAESDDGIAEAFPSLAAVKALRQADTDTDYDRATLTSKLETLEAAVADQAEDWEPDEGDQERLSATEVEPLPWREIEAETADMPEQVGHPEASEEPEVDLLGDPVEDLEAHFEHEDLTAQTDASEPGPDKADRWVGTDAVIDEDALRDMVGEIVRQELQGALGERITRNVRKLVRREIHRALVAKGLE